jgi:hypothetical protein
MLTITRELKNIPISISILHEQEYNNLCNIYKFNIKSDSANKRRAHSEKSDDKNNRGDKLSQLDRPHSQYQLTKSHLKDEKVC